MRRWDGSGPRRGVAMLCELSGGGRGSEWRKEISAREIFSVPAGDFLQIWESAEGEARTREVKVTCCPIGCVLT